jgi:hypothetical protein
MSYVLRVYRRRSRDRIAGIVELPDSQRARPFRCFGELKAILLEEGRDPKRTVARGQR